MLTRLSAGLLLVLFISDASPAQSPAREASPGDAMLAEYFRLQTDEIRRQNLSDIESLDDWTAARDRFRNELLEMLGLKPLPERADLNATITGKIERDDFTVERLHFQSRPGLYVTGNLYVPNGIEKPLPAILYVCGHGQVKKDGVSYGNKVHYQHHGAWFARHGYVCLTIDTLQLGEIEGIHHGTYREKMWWWLNRGYTPAGVEAWNCVRALDYLQSRREVDPGRLGVTGRSGGGAYSWWIAAIDDRIKCAVPVAGITDLQNHVVAGMPGRFHDGCVEGHCDCMYMLNTHRWDYSKVAALVAPRPLLISNTDRDGIFPLDGVYRLFTEVREIYDLHDAADKLALHITAGGHADTQELRVHAFRWFNKHLRDDDSLLRAPAEKFFQPEQLRVFSELPSDERNTTIHESFVPVAEPTLPSSESDWKASRERWTEALSTKCFAGWPTGRDELNPRVAFELENDGIAFRAIDFTSQDPFRLRLYIAHRAGLAKPDLVVLNPLDEAGWEEFVATMRGGFAEPFTSTRGEADSASYADLKRMFASFDWAMAYVAPRGIGPTEWDPTPFKRTQHRRRFYLLGQSLDGMRVYDVRRAMQALRVAGGMTDVPLWLQARETMAGIALYASLFEPDIVRLDLHQLPTSHRTGPVFLNVRRYLDIPQAVAMAAERSRVVLYQKNKSPEGWEYPLAVAKQLGWKKAIQLRSLPSDE